MYSLFVFIFILFNCVKYVLIFFKYTYMHSLISVMYMGGMPFYPPGPNAQPQCQWPFGPVPFAFPSTQYEPQAPPPNFQFPFNLGGPQSSSSFPVYTSGPATSVSTKTTTVTSNTVSSLKVSKSKLCSLLYLQKRVLMITTVELQLYELYMHCAFYLKFMEVLKVFKIC